MNILVLNCGSSSIKYQLLQLTDKENLIAKGQVDRIGIEGSSLVQKTPDGRKVEKVVPIPDHTVGINLLLDLLIDKKDGVLTSLNEIQAVGHRLVHGGEKFTQSTIIDEASKAGIKECFDLAPLHNPANYAGIEAIERSMPEIPQVAVFDTAFHQSIPKKSFLYPIPYEWYEDHAVRRYGFHGTSHQFVAEKAAKLVGKDIKDLKIITCHLGNGASIAAIEGGKSIDTSMGFTPNEGLMMGTRSGSVDPGALIYIAEQKEMTAAEISDLVNRESGVKGISKLSSDMRDLALAAQEGHEQAQLALDMYALRVKKYIGAYVAELNGLDLLIFTGGIGENNFYVRQLCCENLDYLGITFDKEKNKTTQGIDEVLSLANASTTVMTITTDEELVIARETKALVQ